MLVEQPIAHIMSIVGHYRARSSLSRNFSQLIESYMMMAGLQESPLINTSIINYVDAPWLEVTRTFLRDNNIIIKIPVIPEIPNLRQRDKNIMELAEEQSGKKSFLHTINKCRSFLQITCLSEMCNEYGTCILDYFRDPTSMPNHTPQTYRESKMLWHQQCNPPAKAWTQWRKFLQVLIKQGMKLELNASLGDWTTNYTKYITWHYTKDDNKILEIQHDTTTIWTYDHTVLRTQHFTNPTIISSMMQHQCHHPVFPTILNNHLEIGTLLRRTNGSRLIPNKPKQVSEQQHYIDQFTHSLFIDSFDQLSGAKTVDIYASMYQYVSNLSIGWVIADCSEQYYPLSRVITSKTDIV